MSKKGGKGVLKRFFSKDENSEASSSAGTTTSDKKKKKKGSILRKGATTRDSIASESPIEIYDPQRLSTIFSEGQTHAPTVTRAPTVTDYQPNAGYFDEGSVRTPSEIHIHDHAHGGMTSPTLLGGPWNTSPDHAHIPLHVPPSRNASVRQAPSAITRHGTVIHDHGSVMHASGGSGGMGGSFRGPPSHIHPDSMEGHTHKSMRSQRTHRSSAQHDAPIYVNGGYHDGFEPTVVNAGAPPSGSGNANYFVVDNAGHRRNPSITRQPTVITPANADETVLKPGDTMEIDPTNPPIFMLDDGVELEIDDGNGFMPYNQFMEEFRRRPAPAPPSTFVVHGAGDVIIQDEHGNHIQTIPGRGAEAGRGQPQRYNVNGSTVIVL